LKKILVIANETREGNERPTKALLSSLEDSPDVGVFEFATHPICVFWRDGAMVCDNSMIT
jgi:hypothetical protein